MFRRFHGHRIHSHPSRPAWHALGVLLAAALAGCGGDDNGTQPPLEPQPASTAPRVKFKGPHRMASDLSQGLSLSRQDLCRELGSYDCFDAHTIVLGGVEPYRLRIDQPLPDAPVTASMAVDRIALSACGERAARDFAAPGEAALFAEVAGAPGAMPSPSARAAVAKRLYERLLARAAEPDEVDALVAFGDEVTGVDEPARQWAQLACYAVATTTEFLFY